MNIPNRQSGLPIPKNTRDVGNGGMPSCHMGRITWVYEDGTVDVVLDDLTPLQRVEVFGASSGPDRDSSRAPHKLSLVAVLYAYGDKAQPFIFAVGSRNGRTVTPAPVGAWREVLPNGMHFMVLDNGNLEIRAADGGFITWGLAETPAEDHTGQKREADSGDPLNPQPDREVPKPSGFKFTMQTPDGARFQLAGGAWTVHLPGDANISAVNVNVEASGKARLHGAVVEVIADGVCDVKGAIVKLNGGSMPIARVGDSTFFGGPILPPGNLTVLG